MRKTKTVSTSLRRAVIAAASLAVLVSSALAFKAQKKEQQSYGLISGTVYGPDDRPLYGAKIQIHPVGKKHPNWERMSDHRGEFAQRVPLNPADYEVLAEAEFAPVIEGKPQPSRKKRVQDMRKVHVEKDVIQDISLHLREKAPLD
jgi:hypothetical protein